MGPLKLDFDTMLASYVVDERPGIHNLGVLSIERLGSPNWKHEITKYIPKGGNYADVPRNVLYQYNAFDVANTYNLKSHFLNLMDDDAKRLHDFLVRAANQLMYPELNGIKVDRDYSLELSRMFLERLGVVEDALTECVKVGTAGSTTVFNPRSPKQIKAFFETQGVRLDTTNKEALAALYERLQPGSNLYEFVGTLLEHRRKQKLHSTYVVGIRKRMYRGRVYTTYLLHGSTSGRLASRNPNLQNIVRDKDIKRQFVVSRDENIFVHADYKQAEGRVIATLAKDEYLRSIFSDPTRDIFDELCNQIYGVGKWNKEGRIRIKAFFYGIGYGRTIYSIAHEFKMSLNEADRLYRSLSDLIPATMAWQQQIKEAVLSGQDLTTTFGRRRRFWLITDQNRKDVLNEALSFKPQSTASDICLSAFVELRPMLRGIGFVRLTIHDALVVEAPEDRKDEVADMMKTVMVAKGKEWTDYVPFEVDTTFGKDWGSL